MGHFEVTAEVASLERVFPLVDLLRSTKAG